VKASLQEEEVRRGAAVTGQLILFAKVDFNISANLKSARYLQEDLQAFNPVQATGVPLCPCTACNPVQAPGAYLLCAIQCRLLVYLYWALRNEEGGEVYIVQLL
jgi:hypothetical protein